MKAELSQRLYQVQSFPSSLPEDIEWTQLLEEAGHFAINEAARETIRSSSISSDSHLIRRQLLELAAFKAMLLEERDIPLGIIEEVEEILNWLVKPGYVLDLPQLRQLTTVLRSSEKVFSSFDEQVPDMNPLVRYFTPLKGAKEQLAIVDVILDETGNIRPDASEELLRISNEIEAAHRKMDRIFDRELQDYSERGWLKETEESIKNGFRVLAVKPEFKRQIDGLLMDESASGQTFFIAPQALIEAQNNLRHLEAEYQKELHRILSISSDALREHISDMRGYYPALITLDVLRSKAKYALQINGELPEITDRPGLEIRSGVHPVLLTKNMKTGKETVRFDLRLSPGNRILLISGPNAGGKSILMKAIGLLQIMTQAGFLPPVDPDSKIGVFRKIMSDIGDQQSLEEDLSTYSSKLRNMSEMLRRADRHTLLLIDEFGSGTDPAIGGALAEAILYNFIKRKSFAVITTHYSNLKIFASREKGILNGAMHFDKEKLTPTYHFIPGNPGSSFAYEIAEKSGIPAPVVQAAKKKAGKSQTQVEDLLIQLRHERDKLQSQMEEYTSKGKMLDALIRQYDQLKHELRIKKKKLRIEEQELKLGFLESKRQKLNTLLKHLETEKDVEKTKAALDASKDEKERAHSKMQEDIEALYYKEDGASLSLQTGDYVKLKIGGLKGRILNIKNRKATIDCGTFTLESELKDLVKTGNPIRHKHSKAHRLRLQTRKSNFDSKLDIRGMGRSDALNTIQQFLDEALLANAFELTILHGKGNGVLKMAVREKLKDYKAIKKVFHPSQEQGGEGITIVQLG